MAEISTLFAQANLLIQSGSLFEAREVLNKVIHIEPNNAAGLWQRAVVSLRQGALESALADLYQLLALEPANLSVRNQIRFIHRKLVGAWHFGMMHDAPRNEAFEAAINRVVSPNSLVLEIGTGSGLLAMMAARAGARHVYTCEKALPIRKAAREIIRRNGLAERITVIDKWSTQVTVPDDLPEKADVLIAEIFGPALLDEEALHFFADARARLLKPTAKIIPLRGTMHAALLQSEEIHHQSVVGTVSGFDLKLFNALQDEPGIQLGLNSYPHEFLSAPFELESIEFRNEPLSNLERLVSVPVVKSGLCHGCVQWFTLCTDEHSSVSTSHTSPPTHWQQYVQLYVKPFAVTQGSSFQLILRRYTDRFSLVPRDLPA